MPRESRVEMLRCSEPEPEPGGDEADEDRGGWSGSPDPQADDRHQDVEASQEAPGSWAPGPLRATYFGGDCQAMHAPAATQAASQAEASQAAAARAEAEWMQRRRKRRRPIGNGVGVAESGEDSPRAVGR